jgi:hypothetical protein
MNKFQTCQGCPDRSVACHGACPGYQAREQEKQQRYARTAIKNAGYYESSARLKRIKEHNRLVGLGFERV